MPFILNTTTDSGAGRDTASNIMIAFSFNSVFLTGFSYPVRIGKTVISTMLLCRLPRGMDDPDFQFTTTWFQPIWKNRILLTGFIDVWSQDKLADRDKKEIVFQSEPQTMVYDHPEDCRGRRS